MTFETADRIVCGVGDHGSPAAVAHAAAEADRLGITLHLVSVIPVPMPEREVLEHRVSRSRREAEERLQRATQWAQSKHPEVSVSHEVIATGWVAAGLARAAASARWVVVQQTRHGDVYRLAAGSTADGLAYRTRVPMLSVPAGWADTRTSPPAVTVAVQDETEAPGLIEAGLEQAEARGAELVVLHTVGPRSRDGGDDEEVSRAHRTFDPIADTAGELYPDVKIHVHVVRGRAAEVLLEASDVSLALVLGRRRHDHPWGSHLGPVVRRVLLDATCPVVLPGQPSPGGAAVTAQAQDPDGRAAVAAVPVGGEVVVAVGPSDHAAALAYAVADARRRHAALHIVHAVRLVSVANLSLREQWEEARANGRDLVERVARDVRGAHPDLQTSTHLVEHGTVVAAILDQADGRSVVVLQHRRRSPLRRVVTSSTTNGVAVGAGVPVVAVPDGWLPDDSAQAVVVGVKDPTDVDAAVLAAAFAEAARRRAPLHVVHADWYAGTAPDVDAKATGRWDAAVRAPLEQAVAPFHRAAPDVRVDLVARSAPPARALVSAVAGPALVVLGRHGRAHRTGTHLGPVARAVLDSATCPVMLVDAATDR